MYVIELCFDRLKNTFESFYKLRNYYIFSFADVADVEFKASNETDYLLPKLVTFNKKKKRCY